MFKIFSLVLSVFLMIDQIFAQSVPMQSLQEAAKPDMVTVYVAKKIITMDDQKPQAAAVAISGNLIVAVGSLDEVKQSLKGQEYNIDSRFTDKIIMPGLIDPHLHLWLLTLVAPAVFITPDDWDMPWAKIKGVMGREAYLEKLREAEKAMKDGKEWLVTWGYHQYFHGQISRKDLDEISMTRPILIWHRSVHEMYFNTAAIDALKVTEESLKGLGHASEQTDFANGHFWESGLMTVAPRLFPILASEERFMRGLKMAKEYVRSKGLTTTADPGIMLPDSALNMMKKVFDTDDTPFRSLLIPSGQVIFEKYGSEKALQETEKFLLKSSGRVYYLPKQIKLFCDGAAFSQNMQMKDGYLDGHKGSWIQVPQELEEAARLYWNADYHIRVHVNGDLGSEVTIGVLDKLMKENPRKDHRFLLDHYCVSTVDQARQIASLGGNVSTNPYYVYALADNYSQFGLGPERAEYMVRNNSLLKNKIPLSLHSDTTMAPPNPFYLAWCAVNRLTMSGKVVGPEERISVEDALKAITINGAFALCKEKEIGSITPGKIADFTIIEQDPLSIAPEKLKDIAVWGTIFEGKVFQNESASPLSLNIDKGTARLEHPFFAFASNEGERHDCTCAANQIFQSMAREQREKS